MRKFQTFVCLIVILWQFGCNKDTCKTDAVGVTVNGISLPTPLIELPIADTAAYEVSIVPLCDDQRKDLAIKLSITDGSINYNGKNANQHTFVKNFSSDRDTLRLIIKPGAIANSFVVFKLVAQKGDWAYEISQPIRFNKNHIQSMDTSRFSLASFDFNYDSIHSLLSPVLNFTFKTDTSFKGLSVKFSSTKGSFQPSDVGVVDIKGSIKMQVQLDPSEPYATQTNIKAVLLTNPTYYIDTLVSIFSEVRAINALHPSIQLNPGTIVAGDSASIATITVSGKPEILTGKNVTFRTSLGKFLFSTIANSYETNFDNNGIAKAYLHQDDTLKTGTGIILVDFFNGVKLDTAISIVK